MEEKDRYSDVRPGRTNPGSNFWLRFALGAIAVAIVWFFFVRPDTFTLSSQQQNLLLGFARQQLTATVAGEGTIDIPASEISGRIAENGAAFVTLTMDGTLRGCMIDQFEPHEPLYENVLRNVQLAATEDDRFPPVTAAELASIRIAISVVYDIRPVSFDAPSDLVGKLEPFVDGVILDIDGQIATYLPSVWATFPETEEFLSQLCIKAGWAPDRWRTEPYPDVRTYRVLEFGEP